MSSYLLLVANLDEMQLLYSVYSTACIINPEYADPANFDQVMDIFATESLFSARLLYPTLRRTFNELIHQR